MTSPFNIFFQLTFTDLIITRLLKRLLKKDPYGLKDYFIKVTRRSTNTIHVVRITAKLKYCIHQEC